MSKTLVALAVAAACGLGANAAQAKDLTGWFVNAGVGTAHYHALVNDVDVGSESDTSAQINGGWRSQFIGVEAGYIDLGSIGSRDGLGNSYDLSGDGWTLGLNAHLNPTKMWYISARGGAFLWKLHARQAIVDGFGTITRYTGSQQSTDWYAGVGTGVDFNRHMSLGVNFDFYNMSKDNYDIDTRVFTVNFEYRF